MGTNKILIVDDNIKNIQLVLNILKEYHYSFSYALNGKDALELIDNEEFDLIMLDVMMPVMDGYEVAKELQEKKVDTPIIFLTAKSSKDHIVKGFEFGCVDYVVKPFYSKELIARVKVHMELVSLRKELLLKATTDYLTLLPNRREFYEQLERLCSKKGNTAIAIVDIDRFKRINDTYGHDAGDLVLKEFAQILQNNIKSNLYGRIGGEEFAIAYFGLDYESIVEDLEKLRELSKESVVSFGEINIYFTISVGFAFGNTDQITTKMLLTKADTNLYFSKNNGRNLVTGSKI